jgi:cellulose synthase operon protein C
MRRTVNLRFLLVFLTTLTVIGVGVHFVHGYQLKRNATVFLRQAEEAESAGQPEKAVELLGRYLGFRPDDAEALARHALLLGELAKTQAQRQRAYLAMETVLRQSPDRQDVRRRAATLAMTMGRASEGKHHLELELKDSPGDAELEDLLAQCEEASGQNEEARKLYDQAIQHQPDRVDTYVRLANLFRRRLDRPEEAARLMDRLVEANPQSYEARLARASYRKQLGKLEDADEDLRLAREKLAPDRAEVLLASAELAVARNQTDDARHLYQRGAELHPKDHRFPLALATLELRRGADGRPRAVEYLRQALALVPPDQESELLPLANLFADAGESGEAHDLLKRLQASKAAPAAIGLLRARLLLDEGKAGEAVALVEQVRPDLSRSPELGRTADVLLSLGYERLGNPEQQLAAVKRLLDDDPRSLPVRRRYASSLLAAERPDQAIEEYRTLAEKAPETRVILVGLLLVRNLRQPVERRDWSEAERLLAGAPDDLKQSGDFRFRQVELLLAQNKTKEAVTAIEGALKADPKDLRFWLVKATLAERDAKDNKAKSEEALRVLDEAQARVGDQAELRLARAETLARELPPAEATPALRKLEANLAAFAPAQQATLLSGVAAIHARLGSNDEARRLLSRVADLEPDNWGPRLNLLELAQGAGDELEARRQLAEIRRIEGEEGVAWRLAEVVLLVGSVRDGDRAPLAEARKRVAEISKRRPGWSRLALAEAQIEELEGRRDAAIDLYLKAIGQGVSRADVVQKAVGLLLARRRPDEARALLQRYQREAMLSYDLKRLAAQAALVTGAPAEETLKDATAAVSAESKEPRDYLWLGQVRWMAGEKKAADQAFRRAIALAPASVEVWVNLTVFLLRTDRKAEAEAELKKAMTQLRKEDLPYLLVPYFEALGEWDRAEEQYLLILKARPDDPTSLQSLAQFYSRRGEPEKAAPYLARLMGRPRSTYATWARRSRALNLVLGGGYQQTEEALKLVEENLRENPTSPEDLRVRAAVMATRPGGRKKAIKALEDAFIRLRPSAAEELVLARLYEADGESTHARAHYSGAASAPGSDNPLYLLLCVRALVRLDDVVQASVWASKLESIYPGQPQAIEARSLVLKAQGHADQAGALVRKYAREAYQARKDPQFLRGSAVLAEELGRPFEAEDLFRFYRQEVEGKKPEAVLDLAGFLARQGRLADALDLCDRAWTTCKTEAVAFTAVASLGASKHPAEVDFRRVEQSLDAALAKKPENATLLLFKADLRKLEGRADETEPLYRDLLRKDPNNPVVLNNLAWQLSSRDGGRVEALELIDRAISAAGPEANLLDTRGMIHLRSGLAAPAVDDLQVAVAEAPTAVRWFHLAVAQQMAGNLAEAARSWRKAREKGLAEADVSTTELSAFRQLAEKLDRH